MDRLPAQEPEPLSWKEWRQIAMLFHADPDMVSRFQGTADSSEYLEIVSWLVARNRKEG
jgi:hypothetical protein